MSDPAAPTPETPRHEREFPACADDLLGWVSSGVNSVQRARDAQRMMTRLEAARDEALREAWKNRQSSATMGDLSALTGVSVAMIAAAVYLHRKEEPA